MNELSLQEELILVEKAKNDIAAFEALYNYYFPIIFRYCRNRLPNTESTEDVTSIVFLKAVDNIKKFNTAAGVRFGSWLYKTAHNAIIDYLKKQRYHKFVSVEDAEELPEIARDEQDPAEKHEQRLQVLSVLSELNERYQFILSLKFYEEFENPRIAEIMGMKTTAVAVLLHRALQDFKRKFSMISKKSDIFTIDNRYSKQDD